MATKDSVAAELHKDKLNHFLILGFVSAYISWIAISTIEQQWPNNGLCSTLMLPSTSTFSNIGRREYSLTVDEIRIQLPSRNNVSFAFDRWKSIINYVMMSVIPYYMNGLLAVQEVQLAINKVDSLFVYYVDRELWIVGQG